eukprot:5219969-Pleurochrysis_carterae.AAC.2
MRNERRRGAHGSAYTPHDVQGCNDPQRNVAAFDEPGSGCGQGGKDAQTAAMGDRVSDKHVISGLPRWSGMVAMPLRGRLGRIGGASAGEPRGGAHRRRWREHVKETTGGRRPEACEHRWLGGARKKRGGAHCWRLRLSVGLQGARRSAARRQQYAEKEDRVSASRVAEGHRAPAAAVSPRPASDIAVSEAAAARSRPAMAMVGRRGEALRLLGSHWQLRRQAVGASRLSC